MNRDIALCVALSPGQETRLADGIGTDFTLRSVAPDEPCHCPVVFGNPDADRISGNPNLRWLQLESVGFGEYAGLDWSRGDERVTVTNLAGFFAEPVAESALAGILAHYRGIADLVRFQSGGRWVGDSVRSSLRVLRGARVVFVGYGAINARLAEMLAPFGCAITPIARSTGTDALDTALATADIVVCTAPATTATAGLFDAGRLGRLPPGALFCNFGRGSIVDDDALADALHAGALAGAVIDVTRDEPLPASHRFWTCPNLILTQHSGGGTSDELDRKIDVFLANLERFRAAKPLDGVVDFTRGY